MAQAFRIDGQTITLLPAGHRHPPAVVATVVDAPRAATVPADVPRVYVAPSPPDVGRKAGARRVAAAVARLQRKGRVVSGHADLSAATRAALSPAAPTVVHAPDPGRRLAAYLQFRERLPALRGDPQCIDDPVLAAAIALAGRTKRFARLVEQAGPPRLGFMASTFASLARSIVYQQLSGRAAGTIWERFRQSLPGARVTAAHVLARDVPALRAVGLSNNKARSLLDLAARVSSGALRPRSLRHRSDEEVIEALTDVRGIGPWSAQMHLMFALGRLDVWPAADLGVRKGLAKYLRFSDTPDERAALPLGDRFAPYRSVGAWYMWRILDVGLDA